MPRIKEKKVQKECHKKDKAKKGIACKTKMTKIHSLFYPNSYAMFINNELRKKSST